MCYNPRAFYCFTLSARKWFESKRVKCPCPLCRTTWTLRSQRTLNFQIEPLPLSSDTLSE